MFKEQMYKFIKMEFLVLAKPFQSDTELLVLAADYCIYRFKFQLEFTI